MKRILHSIPLKVIAAVTAATALLITILSSIALLWIHYYNPNLDGSWFESAEMTRHNSSFISQLIHTYELAVSLAEEGEPVPELLVLPSTQTTSNSGEEAQTVPDSSEEALSVNQEAPSSNVLGSWFAEELADIDYEERISMYADFLETTARFSEYYALSDGENILFASPLFVSEAGSHSGDLASLFSLLPFETDEQPSIIVDTGNNEFYVNGEAILGSNSDYSYVGLADQIVLVAYNPAISNQNADGFFGSRFVWEELLPLEAPLITVIFVSAFVFIILLIYVVAGAGYRRTAEGNFVLRGQITLSWVDRIPFELLISAAISVVTLSVLMASDVVGYNTNSTLQTILNRLRQSNSFIYALGMNWIAVFFIWVSILFIALFFLSLVRRLKAKVFWRYTAVGWILRKMKLLYSWLKIRIDKRPKLLLFLALYYLAVFIFALQLGYMRASSAFFFGFILFALLPMAVATHLIFVDKSMRELRDYSSGLANGTSPSALDASKLHPQFRDLSDNLEKLDQGLQHAVERQLRSDRLKTDLITNVSHDLKTPLTTIINYIDLLKQEGLDGPNAESYLVTLETKANRLKQLTEDLVEASKASSGNLSVEREWLDLLELMRQVSGEFDDKLAEGHLTLVMRLPQNMHRFMVWSDGRHLWRILENLIENARKYSLSGSRVYVSLFVTERECRLRIKNVSAIPIDLSTDDLMERFVRGDSARQSEGSGLGLSITSSLATLLGGRMELDVKDDIFTAEVVLPNVDAPLQAPKPSDPEKVSPADAENASKEDEPFFRPLDVESGNAKLENESTPIEAGEESRPSEAEQSAFDENPPQ